MPNRSWILAESLRQDDSVLSTRKEPDLSRGSPKIKKVDAEFVQYPEISKAARCGRRVATVI